MKFKRNQKVKLIEQIDCVVQNMCHTEDSVPGVRVTISIPGHKDKWWAVVPVTMVEVEND